jgi:phage terminase large subunit-like protein
MSARIRRVVIATVATALSVGLSAGVVAAGSHQTGSQRVVADNHWCC